MRNFGFYVQTHFAPWFIFHHIHHGPIGDIKYQFQNGADFDFQNGIQFEFNL